MSKKKGRVKKKGVTSAKVLNRIHQDQLTQFIFNKERRKKKKKEGGRNRKI